MLTSYQAERQSILDTLAGLGDANDKFSAIALPDYIASGGNIYVTADHFGGSGSLEAKGGPQINITNSSSALLQLGTMNIGGSGGQLIVNDEVMASNQAEAQNRINSTFNTNTSLKAQFASLKSDPASSSNASINIVNKDNATGYTIVNKTDHSTKAYNALLHIQVLKDIINPLGNITINNMANNGNIELSGTADVMAKSVTLKANGSISRAYSAGITHVGGAPEYQYSEIAMYDKENSYINSRANGYRTDDQTQVITNTKGEATIQPGTSTYNDLYNRGSSDGDKLAKQLAAVSVIDRFNDLMGQYQNVSKAYNDMGGDDKYYEYRHDLDNYNSKKARGKFIWAWEKTWAKTAMKKLPTMDSYRSQMSNLWNQISPLYSILDAADHSYLSTDSQTVRNGLAAIQSQVYTRIDSNSSAYIAGLQTHLSQIAAYSSIASDINNRINTAVADVAKEANREKGWVAGRLIRLNVNGSDVGTAENPLDIMANGSAVSVYGADDVYLNGINSNKAGSKLILGDVRPAGQLSVSSETDIQVGRDEFDRVASDGTTVHEDAVPGIVVVKDDLNLTANNVIINGQVGVLSDPADPATVIPGKTVTLIAKKGTVSETEKGQVLTNTLVAQAVKGITMNSEQNVFNAVKFGAYTPGQALDGNVTIKTSSDSLTLANISDTNKPTVDGNIYVENVKDGGTMDVSATLVAHKVVDDLGQVVDGRLGLITLIAKGNVANTGNINSNDDVILRSDYGTVTAAGSINSLGVVSMTGKTGAVAAGSITSGDDKDITIYSETGPVDVSGAITAGKNVTITTSGIAATDETAGVAGDVTVNGSITAKNGKAVINTSLGDVHVAGILSAANGDAAIHTTDGDVGVDGTVTATNGNAEITTTNGNVRIGAAGEANSGTVTGNNVTVTTTAGKMDIHGNVTANTGDVTLGTVYTGTDPANGAISVDGNVTAAQAVAATTNVGNILFDGNVKGTDVTMATNVGTITVTGNTEATTGAVSATTNATDAEKGAINFNGTVTGKTDVTATTKSGAITFTQAVTATDNNVSANTVDGAISFNGETNAGNDITAKATNTGSISFAGNANAANNVTATTNTGTVTFNGNTTAESGSVTATTVDGTITFNGNTQAAQDVTATATNNGAITVTDGHTVNAGHDVTATAKNGNIDFGGTVTATNLLKATNENGDILFKGAASGADVTMATKSGNISVTGDTTATTGSVTASTATTEAGKGAINFNGTVTGKTDVTATTKSGSITFNNAVTATDNNVTANTVDGAIAFNGNTKAGNDVAVNATNTGSITFNGNTDTAHDVTANANLGAVTFNGNTTAANDIGVNTNVGAVTFNGNTAADHDVTVDTNVGAITFNGDTSAARDVVANTNAGSITTTAGHSLKAGNDITATAQDGDISFAGAVQAGENVKATTQNTGNIEFNGAVEAVNKDILAKTNTGNVTVKKDIAANQNINVYTKNGSIVFGGNAENPTKDVYATAKNGSIYLTVDQTGDIKDTHREMNGYSARLRAGQDSPVDNPNVIISQNGIGTVDLAEITAKQAANIRTENGTIHIGHLDGQVVAVVGRDDVSKVVVDQLNAGQQVNIEANDVTIKAMKQLPDSTVPLTVSTMGDAPNKPMSSLVIEDIQTENGVVFPHLWLNTGAITTTKGAMDITKYYVLDKAQISNGNMITNIYGTAPIREPKTMSTYWNDTGINNPLQDMTGWYAAGNNPKWAFIRYENQGNRQIANGHLLSLDEHYYAYNQRYTVEDEMRRMSTPKLQDFYPHYYNPDLAYYNRFESAVITGNPVKVNNAKDDEILIEAAAEVNG